MFVFDVELELKLEKELLEEDIKLFEVLVLTDKLILSPILTG
jgi:hypothetical protein